MDPKLVRKFLPFAVIPIITTAFFFWSHQWRRSRESGKSNSKDGGEDTPSLPPPPMKEDGFQYDVFVSFRGADTRKGFTGHLFQALQDKGIFTFIDSEALLKGQKVEDLFGFIERSRIFVPIFSKGYADSKWCLKEIAKMVECKRLIVPVFIDVDPRDVRHQNGPFAPAFRRHRRNKKIVEEVSKWSDALSVAGGTSGYNLADALGNEAKLVQLIVKRILVEINKTPLFVAKHPVGLEPRIADVKKLLDVEAQDNVRMVGIHGLSGIGKTTLAKAVYNQISSLFDACSFIAKVREAAKQSSGLVSLQKQLLHDIFKEENVDISNSNHGIGIIKRRIRSKKVLLVLDDVDDEAQLIALADSVDWFCLGSRIIVTTKDKSVLQGPRMNQNEVYKLEGLKATQSLELFSWHAFGKGQPVEDFAELSQEVASTAAGLPLALIIFGSHFFDLKTAKEWEVMLKKLKEDQDKDIHKKLRICFDELDEKEKKVFLDIACFFIGVPIEYAILMWEACKFFPDVTIKVLMHKSLVNINDETGEFEMHDQIWDMGRKIVDYESLSNPGMRSRLWKEDEILNVLQNKSGTNNVEAIQLFCESTDSISIKAESFTAMSQLKMLRLRNVTLEGECDHFPKILKWLEWSPQDMDSLPSALHLEDIVVLDLSGPSITQVWKPPRSRVKVLNKLKVLDLSTCENLSVCPDFTSMPHLQILDFAFCWNITELCRSIKHLKNLTRLSLYLCQSLKELPEEVCQLTSLEMLDLTYCKKISTLPSQLGNLKSLKQFFLNETSITTLPQSMRHLKQLNHLSLEECSSLIEIPACVCSLLNLEVLDAGKCHSLASLPNSLGNLRSLRKLDFSWTDIEELPDSVVSLEKLEVLLVAGCKRLKFLPASASIGSVLLKSGGMSSASGNRDHFRKSCPGEPLERQHYSLPQFPPSLTILNAAGCHEMEMIADVSNARGLQELDLGGCQKLVDVPGVGQLKKLMKLKLSGCRSLHDSLHKRLQEAYFENLRDFSISASPIDGEASNPQSALSFVVPNQFTEGLVSLYVDESSLDSSSSQLRKRTASAKHALPVDSQGRHLLLQMDVMTDDAELVFSTSVNRKAYGAVGMAVFEGDSGLMKAARQGGFVGNDDDDAQRRTMTMMRMSISGCVLLGGDLQTSRYFRGQLDYKFQSDHPIVAVKFG